MLAYVFWHRARAGVPPVAYQQSLLEFHRALAAAAPHGLVRSATFSVDQVPWLPAGADEDASEPGYADWYLTGSSAALDELNAAAVGPLCAQAHTEVAACTGPSCAGLYTLRAGDSAIEAGRVATWVSKPRGMGYREFDAGMEAALRTPGTGLWRRQMVLGPTPEFCLLAPAPVAPPVGEVAVVATAELLWSGHTGSTPP